MDQMVNRLSINLRHLSFWKISVLVICLLCICQGTSAQEFEGKVTDSDKNVLEGANVIVLGDSAKTLCFSITDVDGKFHIEVPDNVAPKQVCVRYIGYETKTLPFSELKNGMTIRLESGKFQLKEVRVKASKIRSQGDTLSYAVAAFKQGQDRSIADVIRKMPGLEVGSDGRVTFQGTAINKFYIEGLDLMGSQYGIANNNLSADKIKSVQVLQNHQPVKSLRGVSFSDHAALNLVLKDTSKDVWSGVVDLGLGYGNDVLYNTRVLGMCFNKKRQTLMMYKNNNTGQNVAAEVNRLTNGSALQDRNEMENGLLSLLSTGSLDIDRERYTFNRSHLLAGNWLWKMGANTELRIQGNGYIDKMKMQNTYSTTYLTLADLPVVVEEQNISNYRSQWKGEANYQYNGNKTFVSNNLCGYVDFNKSVGSMLYNSKQTDMMVKPHKQRLADTFRLSHTTKNGNAYEVNALFSYLNMPGELLTLNNVTERLDLRFLSSQGALKYKLKIGKHYLNSEVGMSYDRQEIGVTMGDNVKNANAYQLWQAYFAPSLLFNFGDHKINGVVKLNYLCHSYKESQESSLFVEPRISWNWQATSVSSFSAIATLTNEPLSGTGIYDTRLFTNYRTMKTNRGEVTVQHKASVAFGYQYTNPLKGIFFNIRPYYNLSSDNILYQNSLEDGVYMMQATDKDYTTRNQGVRAKISKSFGWADLFVGLGGSHAISTYQMLVGERLDKARLYSSSVSLDYSLRPLRTLSVEGTSEVHLYEQCNLSERDLYPSKNVSTWEHHLDFHFLPDTHWMFSLKNELHHSKGKNLGTNYYCDLTVSYKASRWELSLATTNLLGTSQYKRQTLSSTRETYSITTLRPREYMVNFSFDL